MALVVLLHEVSLMTFAVYNHSPAYFHWIWWFYCVLCFILQPSPQVYTELC